MGEQPLKHVPTRKGKDSMKENDTRGEDDAGTALYAFQQTTQYSAPPVINGRIPKNMYGNLDVYVPSMVPEGGFHIRHPDTSRAARLLGIDYADAVTGFSFRGRHGTAIITGAVVAESCQDAIEEVISAFEIERREEEEQERILEALRTWKKFLLGLRIRERIQGYEIEGERKIADEAMGQEEESAEDDEGGGFIPDRDMTGHAKPGSSGNTEQTQGTDNDDGGGFLLDDELDDQHGPTSKFGIDDLHKASWRSDHHNRQGGFGHENLDKRPIVGANENEYETGDTETPFQPADRTKLPANTDTDASRQELTSPAFKASKLQAPIKQPSQPRRKTLRVAKTSQNHTMTFQNESSLAMSGEYLPQTTQPIDPNRPPSSSTPDLPDAEMAEALALQQIHDSQSLKKAPESLPSTNRPESNLETSHFISATSSSPHQRSTSTSSSPPRNTPLPGPPALATITQDSSPPPPNQEKFEEIKNTKSGAPPSLRQGDEHQLAENTKKSTDRDNNSDNESEDSGSLLSRDPSDEDADPSWLDF